MSPVISTMPGSAVFAAGKGLGQIEAEKESYTRGVEEARMAMQQQQINDQRKMREIAANFKQEQLAMQGVLAQQNIARQEQAAATAKEQWRKEFGLREKGFEAGQEEFEKELELDKTKAAMRDALEKQKLVIKGEKEKLTEVEKMKKHISTLDKQGWEPVVEGAPIPKDMPSFVDEYGKSWYKPEKIGAFPKLTESQRIRNLNWINTLRRNKVITPGAVAGEVKIKEIIEFDDINDSLIGQKVDSSNPEVKAEIDRFVGNYFATKVFGKKLSTEEKKDAETFLERYNAIQREKGEPGIEFSLEGGVFKKDYWTIQVKGEKYPEKEIKGRKWPGSKKAQYNRLRDSGLSEEEAKRRLGL